MPPPPGRLLGRTALTPAILCVALVAPACAPPDRTGVAVAADGARLAYRVVGTGADTVLVVPDGPALPAAYLRGPLAPLTRGRTLVLVDPRGRGRSTAPAGGTPPSLAADVADLERVRAALGVQRPALLAHGWGAATAVHYAAAHPAHVRRLVLVAPVYPRARWSWAYAVRGLPARYGASLRAARAAGLDTGNPRAFCERFWGVWLSPAVVTDDEAVRSAAPAVCDAPPARLRGAEALARSVVAPLGDWQWGRVAAAVRAPALVVVAPADTLETRTAAEWRDSIPGARLLTAGGAARLPWVRGGEGWHRGVDAFLQGRWPAAAHAATPSPVVATRGAAGRAS